MTVDFEECIKDSPRFRYGRGRQGQHKGEPAGLGDAPLCRPGKVICSGGCRGCSQPQTTAAGWGSAAGGGWLVQEPPGLRGLSGVVSDGKAKSAPSSALNTAGKFGVLGGAQTGTARGERGRLTPTWEPGKGCYRATGRRAPSTPRSATWGDAEGAPEPLWLPVGFRL